VPMGGLPGGVFFVIISAESGKTYVRKMILPH
jgi:hypothetical protein